MINDDFAYSSTRESCKSIITLAELERFSYNLKERKISFQYIVEIGYRVNPRVTARLGIVATNFSRWNNLWGNMRHYFSICF